MVPPVSENDRPAIPPVSANDRPAVPPVSANDRPASANNGPAVPPASENDRPLTKPESTKAWIEKFLKLFAARLSAAGQELTMATLGAGWLLLKGHQFPSSDFGYVIIDSPPPLQKKADEACKSAAKAITNQATVRSEQEKSCWQEFWGQYHSREEQKSVITAARSADHPPEILFQTAGLTVLGPPTEYLLSVKLYQIYQKYYTSDKEVNVPSHHQKECCAYLKLILEAHGRKPVRYNDVLEWGHPFGIRWSEITGLKVLKELIDVHGFDYKLVSLQSGRIRHIRIEDDHNRPAVRAAIGGKVVHKRTEAESAQHREKVEAAKARQSRRARSSRIGMRGRPVGGESARG